MSHTLAIDEAAWASPWRQKSVVEKALLSFGLIAVGLILPVMPGALLIAGVALVVLLGPARVSMVVLLRTFRGPLTFILIGSFSVLFSVGWVDGLRVTVTEETMDMAVSVLGHGIAGTLAVYILAATTPMVDLLGSMRRVHVPQACIDIAGLIYRLVFVLLDTVHQIQEAQTARLGYCDRKTAVRSAAALSGTLLLRAWDRARRLEEGMVGRGYTGSLPSMEPPTRLSAGFAIVTFLTLAAVTVISLAVTEFQWAIST